MAAKKDNRLKVKVIGAGGVGGWLLPPLSHYLNYQFQGQAAITILDGDAYEDKNRERQVFSKKANKATVKCEELRPLYPNIWYTEVASYLTATNIKQNIKEGDTVLVCVDNHATRKLISQHAKTLENVTVISGGNELTDGNVQVYIRKDGKDLTPSLEDYHPEIKNPPDKNPGDRGNSCATLAASAPQLVVANFKVASTMLEVLYAVLEGKRDYNEVYFDIIKCLQTTYTRKVKEKKEDE